MSVPSVSVAAKLRANPCVLGVSSSPITFLTVFNVNVFSILYIVLILYPLTAVLTHSPSPARGEENDLILISFV